MLSKLYYPIASLHTKQPSPEVRHARWYIDSMRRPLLSTRLVASPLEDHGPSSIRMCTLVIYIYFSGATKRNHTCWQKSIKSLDRRHWRKERCELNLYQACYDTRCVSSLDINVRHKHYKSHVKFSQSLSTKPSFPSIWSFISRLHLSW